MILLGLNIKTVDDFQLFWLNERVVCFVSKDIKHAKAKQTFQE
jgi:hypothetical protein